MWYRYDHLDHDTVFGETDNPEFAQYYLDLINTYQVEQWWMEEWAEDVKLDDDGWVIDEDDEPLDEEDRQIWEVYYRKEAAFKIENGRVCISFNGKFDGTHDSWFDLKQS